ncbi:MAG: hypothetical protein FJ012_09005 [Chloroflexi bacterium]|nr:hypothetical protein [Chloroflexota bacterium]
MDLPDTTETEIHNLLRQRLSNITGVKLLGWNPPNAKTYGLPNILIPKFREQRRAGSDRVDACMTYEDVLILTEIKAASSEMVADIAKLRRIYSYWDLLGITQILTRQGIRFSPIPRAVVPAIAFGTLDSSLPQDFLCWHVQPGVYRQIAGVQIPEKDAEVLRRLRAAFERTQDNPEM